MNASRLIIAAVLAVIASLPVVGQVDFETVPITEVSWGDPDGLEIANFTGVTQDLTNWTVEWDDGSTSTSSPLGVILPAGDPCPEK